LLQAVDLLLHRTLELEVGGDLLAHGPDLTLGIGAHPGDALELAIVGELAAHQILASARQGHGQHAQQGCSKNALTATAGDAAAE
jgi:hypothetical protein